MSSAHMHKFPQGPNTALGVHGPDRLDFGTFNEHYRGAMAQLVKLAILGKEEVSAANAHSTFATLQSQNPNHMRAVGSQQSA